jgi:hypothetical protein
MAGRLRLRGELRHRNARPLRPRAAGRGVQLGELPDDGELPLHDCCHVGRLRCDHLLHPFPTLYGAYFGGSCGLSSVTLIRSHCRTKRALLGTMYPCLFFGMPVTQGLMP